MPSSNGPSDSPRPNAEPESRPDVPASDRPVDDSSSFDLPPPPPSARQSKNSDGPPLPEDFDSEEIDLPSPKDLLSDRPADALGADAGGSSLDLPAPPSTSERTFRGRDRSDRGQRRRFKGKYPEVVSDVLGLFDEFRLPYSKGDYVTAKKIAENALRTSEEGGWGDGMIASLSRLADIAHKQEDIETAKEVYHQAVGLAREISPEHVLLPKMLQEMSMIYTKEMNAAMAQKCIAECVSLMDEADNPVMYFFVLRVAGITHALPSEGEDLEKALDYLRDACRVRDDHALSTSCADLHIRMADIHTKRHQFDAARQALHDALAECDRNDAYEHGLDDEDVPGKRTEVLYQMGRVDLKARNMEAAREQFVDVLQMLWDQNDAETAGKYLLELGLDAHDTFRRTIPAMGLLAIAGTMLNTIGAKKDGERAQRRIALMPFTLGWDPISFLLFVDGCQESYALDLDNLWRMVRLAFADLEPEEEMETA